MLLLRFVLSLLILFFAAEAASLLLSTTTSTCSEFEFSCKSDGLCIPLLWKCDLTPDCSDGSDEDGNECDQSSIVQNQCDNSSFFHCKYSQKCIPRQWLCDQVFDCGLIGKFNTLDPSDEEASLNCTIKCPKNKLPCTNGVCLHISKFCDGQIDCANDEFSCSDVLPCKSLKCDYDCKITPHGPQCFCPAGQDVVNSTKCVARKECAEDMLDEGEACDQQCINANEKNQCSCVPGYERVSSRCFGVNCKSFQSSFLLLLKQMFTSIEFPQHPLPILRCSSY
jgi:Low-density lipoprotein receptor domain class A